MQAQGGPRRRCAAATAAAAVIGRRPRAAYGRAVARQLRLVLVQQAVPLPHLRSERPVRMLRRGHREIYRVRRRHERLQHLNCIPHRPTYSAAVAAGNGHGCAGATEDGAWASQGSHGQAGGGEDGLRLGRHGGLCSCSQSALLWTQWRGERTACCACRARGSTCTAAWQAECERSCGSRAGTGAGAARACGRLQLRLHSQQGSPRRARDGTESSLRGGLAVTQARAVSRRGQRRFAGEDRRRRGRH